MKTRINEFFKNKLLVIFSGEKCIKNLFLNFLGLQVFRYLFAKLLYNIKNFNISENEINELKNIGYQVYPNFFNPEVFKKIKAEYYKLINDDKYAKRVDQGSGKIDDGIEYINANIDDHLNEEYSALSNIKNNPKILKYFKLAEKKNEIKINTRLESIKILDNNLPDPQKEYHYDTFHNTFKAWLFIEEVKTKDGPFHYVPLSHKLTFLRVWNEWRLSILYCIKNISSSFRYNINKEFLDKKALKAETKENTLVIANTHGLHRRGDAEIGAKRNSIQLWTRENPFKIFL